jgi:polysaccharide pyruvyl transferase WcaK-like protein
VLVDYILTETEMNVVLVPHVVQPVDNDYDALREINNHGSKRVVLVSDRLSAAQYKHIISKSKFCILARTHAAIAAYSSGVPTLAIAYSIKAHGIAEEFGMPVMDIAEIKGKTAILARFQEAML